MNYLFDQPLTKVGSFIDRLITQLRQLVTSFTLTRIISES